MNCLFCGADIVLDKDDFLVAIPPGVTEVSGFLIAHTACVENVDGVLRDIFMRDDDY